jgi:hypothetical protein
MIIEIIVIIIRMVIQIIRISRIIINLEIITQDTIRRKEIEAMSAKVTDFIKKTKEFSKFNDMSDDMRDIIKDKVFANKTFFNGIDEIYGTVLYMELPENTRYDAGTRLMYSEIYQNDFVLSNTKDGIETTMLDDTVLHAELDEERIYVDNYTDLDFYSDEKLDNRQDVAVAITANNEDNKFCLSITNSSEVIEKVTASDEVIISISNEEKIDVNLEYSIGDSDVVERVEGVYIVVIFPNIKCPAYVRVYNKDLSDDEDSDFIINVQDNNALYNNFNSKYDIKRTTKHVEKNNDIAIIRWDDTFKTLMNVLKNENVILDDYGEVIEYHNKFGLNSITYIKVNEDGDEERHTVIDVNGNVLADSTTITSTTMGLVSINNAACLDFATYDHVYEIVEDNIQNKYNEYVEDYILDFLSHYNGNSLDSNSLHTTFYVDDNYPNIYKMIVVLDDKYTIAYGYIFDNIIRFSMVYTDDNTGFNDSVSHIIDTDKGLELSCVTTRSRITKADDNGLCGYSTDTHYTNIYGVDYKLQEFGTYIVGSKFTNKKFMRYKSNELSLEVDYDDNPNSESFGEAIGKRVESSIYTQNDTVFYIRDEFGVPRKYVLE